VILSLTDESTSKVEKFMEKTAIPFPVGVGTKSKKVYGVRGIPDSLLIDHRGVVAWRGHPGTGAWVKMLPRLLDAARMAQEKWDPGERISALKRAVEKAKKGDMGSCWKESEKLLKKFAEDEDNLAAVEAFRADFTANAGKCDTQVKNWISRGMYFVASEYLGRQVKAYRGSPMASAWNDKVRAWRKDKVVKNLISLDERRMKATLLMEEGKRDKAVKILRPLRKDAAGTQLEALVEETFERATMMPG